MLCPNCKAEAEQHEVNGIVYAGCLGESKCGWFATNPDGSMSPVEELPVENKPEPEPEPEPEPVKTEYQLVSPEPAVVDSGGNRTSSPAPPDEPVIEQDDEDGPGNTIRIHFED